MARFIIQGDRSEVKIGARSNVHPINVACQGVEGYVDFEVSAAGTVDVTAGATGHLAVPVSELKTGNALYDRELIKRIDARRNPEITGDITAVSGSSAGATYRVAGDLSFRGITNHFEDEMTIELADEATMVLDGHHEFDVRAFNLEPPKLFMLKVRPEVQVAVHIVATKEG